MKFFELHIRLVNDHRELILVEAEDLLSLIQKIKGSGALTFVSYNQMNHKSFTLFASTILRIEYHEKALNNFEKIPRYQLFTS